MLIIDSHSDFKFSPPTCMYGNGAHEVMNTCYGILILGCSTPKNVLKILLGKRKGYNYLFPFPFLLPK